MNTQTGEHIKVEFFYSWMHATAQLTQEKQIREKEKLSRKSVNSPLRSWKKDYFEGSYTKYQSVSVLQIPVYTHSCNISKI